MQASQWKCLLLLSKLHLIFVTFYQHTTSTVNQLVSMFSLLEIMLNSLTLEYICVIDWRKPRQPNVSWHFLGQMCLSGKQHLKKDLETKHFIWVFLHLLKANVKNIVSIFFYCFYGIYWAQIQRMFELSILFYVFAATIY